MRIEQANDLEYDRFSAASLVRSLVGEEHQQGRDDNYQSLINKFKIKYADKIKNGLTFEERVLMQEELFTESFKGHNVQFLIQ